MIIVLFEGKKTDLEIVEEDIVARGLRINNMPIINHTQIVEIHYYDDIQKIKTIDQYNNTVTLHTTHHKNYTTTRDIRDTIITNITLRIGDDGTASDIGRLFPM